MIYVDTSVLLAHLLAEDREPPAAMWDEALVSSRLAEYELWTRIHARRLGASHTELARSMLGRLALLEMTPVVLARALEPFPVPLRTLDALHLASAEFLRHHDKALSLATYDARMQSAAKKLGIPVYEL